MVDQLPTIVVVEDDASMSQAIERILRTGGYLAMMFESAEAAIEAGSVAIADCMILDIGLPGMSGLEMSQQLAATDLNVPTIFITAHDSEFAHVEANRLRAKGFLVKPFSGRTLLEVIDNALDDDCTRQPR